MKVPVFPSKEELWAAPNALFPSRLRDLRLNKGLNQNVFSEAIGISRSSVSSYEQGINIPDAETLAKFGDFFGVTYDYLLGRSDNKYMGTADIGKETGLSDEAIETLKHFLESPQFIAGGNQKKNAYTHMLNTLIPNPMFWNLLFDINSFLELNSDEEETSEIFYSKETNNYVYTTDIVNKPEFVEFEEKRKQLFGKSSEIIHKDQYNNVLKFNMTQTFLKIVESIKSKW